MPMGKQSDAVPWRWDTAADTRTDYQLVSEFSSRNVTQWSAQSSQRACHAIAAEACAGESCRRGPHGHARLSCADPRLAADTVCGF